jgi:hypothetical protein
VATAPSPATTGTSLVLDSGEGARFPQPSTDGSFYVTAMPPGENPNVSNSEILQVTARSTDTLTIVREQGDTTAKTIEAGWIILQSIYKENILDEDDMASDSATSLATQQSIKAYSDSGVQTMTNKTLTEPILNKPKTKQKYEEWVDNEYSATITLDLSAGNLHRIDALTGNATLAISNPKTSQAFMVLIPQDGTGGRTITWFSGISWDGGAAPDQTKTASTSDLYGFVCVDDDSSNEFANPTFVGGPIFREIATP